MYPFKKIKIHRSFVRHVRRNREAAAIIRAVTTPGASIDMILRAEGVEHGE